MIRSLSIMTVLVAPVWAQGSEQRTLDSLALRAVTTFFECDSTIPLDAHVITKGQALGFTREKIAFTGCRGHRVPGFLSYPASGASPWPVVILLHSGGSSKAGWWSPDGYERGAELVKGLLNAGYAVLALDAQSHGERLAADDYVPLDAMFFQYKWYARFRDIIVESTGDYRRALQYLAQRPEFDTSRMAVVGQSMGGFMGIYLAALDPRVRVVVAGAAAFAEPWYFPITTLNFARTVGKRPILLLAGRNDALIPLENTQRLFGLLEGAPKDLRLFDSGHQLPSAYTPAALEWIIRYLK